MVWIVILEPFLGNALVTYGGAYALGNIPLDSVLVAPVSGYSPEINAELNEEFQEDHTYVLRTKDGGHAAIRLLGLDFSRGVFSFSYKYQNDGSGRFDTTTSVSAVTWGSLKSQEYRDLMSGRSQ